MTGRHHLAGALKANPDFPSRRCNFASVCPFQLGGFADPRLRYTQEGAPQPGKGLYVLPSRQNALPGIIGSS